MLANLWDHQKENRERGGGSRWDCRPVVNHRDDLQLRLWPLTRLLPIQEKQTQSLSIRSTARWEAHLISQLLIKTKVFWYYRCKRRKYVNDSAEEATAKHEGNLRNWKKKPKTKKNRLVSPSSDCKKKKKNHFLTSLFFPFKVTTKSERTLMQHL